MELLDDFPVLTSVAILAVIFFAFVSMVTCPMLGFRSVAIFFFVKDELLLDNVLVMVDISYKLQTRATNLIIGVVQVIAL